MSRPLRMLEGEKNWRARWNRETLAEDQLGVVRFEPLLGTTTGLSTGTMNWKRGGGGGRGSLAFATRGSR